MCRRMDGCPPPFYTFRSRRCKHVQFGPTERPLRCNPNHTHPAGHATAGELTPTRRNDRRHPPLAPMGLLRAPHSARSSRPKHAGSRWPNGGLGTRKRMPGRALDVPGGRGREEGFRIQCRPLANEMMQEAGDLLWTAGPRGHIRP